jgi:hypothetical protein
VRQGFDPNHLAYNHSTVKRRATMEHSRMIGATVASVAAVFMATGLSLAADGTAKGEASDVKGQQGVGLESGATSSNVVTGGPEPIIGKISGIQGNAIRFRVNEGKKSPCG